VNAGRSSVTDEEFAAAMAMLGPFEPAPRLAAAVSGGADSLALALLAGRWVRTAGGSLLALVVDHRLRAESRQEADATRVRLGSQGISSKLLPITGLAHGPALAERARAARFAALEAACAELGLLHLLLGHHRGDQAETVIIRALGGSGATGMAGMAPVVETAQLRLLRPLLDIPPVRLRATLAEAGLQWVEDPSNRDIHALRPRLRALRRDSDGIGAATAALVEAAATAAQRRAQGEERIAAVLAERAVLRPEGFAVLPAEPLPAPALAALLQTISGSPFPPPARSVAALAEAPRPATLAGVRLLPAGRLGPGLLMVRETAAMAPPVAARSGVVWDGRFRLAGAHQVPDGATMGALGRAAARLRRLSPLPAAVLQTLPAFRLGEALLAVPHLLYPGTDGCERLGVVFSPPRPAVGAPFPFGDA
jgi:tRNA(Ile)-lysidine synthase